MVRPRGVDGGGVLELVPDHELAVAVPARQAIIELDTKDGRTFSNRTRYVRGTPGDPMTTDEVIAKATELMVPILGRERSDGLVDAVMSIEKLADAATLRKFWS